MCGKTMPESMCTHSFYDTQLMPQIESHLQRVKLIHDKDLLEGKGAVYLPK
jgi:hypothetical protein